ncbi:MAG TPA: phosphoribosylaminoimidazolesuccinocarboxamide synthase [bacterium]|nr:phosphoribosylaminoimidazolesuccinocarboxamide synthase [bacterium]
MSLGPTLKKAYFPELPDFYSGKVRENYRLADGQRLIIATDRQSAFDCILAEVPYKGQVLNQISAFWFDQTKDVVPNHVIKVIDPNAMIVKDAKPFPVEVIVRGYITGVTTTSAWYAYERGEREYCGHTLPEGLKKNAKLPEPIITPTTKEVSGHDQKISSKEIIERGIVAAAKWQKIEEYAIALFKRGQEVAAKRGLILVDTKYEFGEDAEGNIMVIDEVHTPDSSRYWIADTYEQRFARGEEPEYYDKEFLRIWLRDQGFMGDGPMPEIPDELIERFSNVYITLYEKITGQTLDRGGDNPANPLCRLRRALKKEGLLKGKFVQIIMGSESDRPHADKIIAGLASEDIVVDVLAASAHKVPDLVLNRVRQLNEAEEPVVYITIAGRSNALSGVVAGASRHPVIACPPFADKSDYLVNIHSSLQMPSNVPVMTVIDPGNAALAAKRILGLS